jgi:hypothetical protein
VIEREREAVMQKWITLWLASLVAVAMLTSAVIFSQSRLPEREYRVLSGSDVGFRVEGTDPSGRPLGRLVLRINGEWVEVAWGPSTRRLN